MCCGRRQSLGLILVLAALLFGGALPAIAVGIICRPRFCSGSNPRIARLRNAHRTGSWRGMGLSGCRHPTAPTRVTLALATTCMTGSILDGLEHPHCTAPRKAKAVARTLHRANLSLHAHSVFSTTAVLTGHARVCCCRSYPGLAITLPNDIDGDFHSAFAGGDIQERLAGLIDIAHENNYQFIRSPVTPGDARNIRVGMTPSFGRLANVPDPANRRFISRSVTTRFSALIRTNQRAAFAYSFNIENPAAGNPSLRTRWDTSCATRSGWCRLIGVDGLRIHSPSMSRDLRLTSSIAQSTAN